MNIEKINRVTLTGVHPWQVLCPDDLNFEGERGGHFDT